MTVHKLDLKPTTHELSVLKAYLECGTAIDASQKLGMKSRTVEGIIDNLRLKSGYRHIAQVVAWAYDNGWLKRGDGPHFKG